MNTLLTLALAAALQNPVKGDEAVPGLVGEYYSIGANIEDFYDLLTLPQVQLKRIDAQVDFAGTLEDFGGTSLRDQFYVRWTGLLRAPRAGKYRFFTKSDDGSRLSIAGRKVVANDGLHQMTEESGEVDLKSGSHEIQIEFFDNRGPAGCIVSWEGPEITKQVIPAAALFHRKRAEAVAPTPKTPPAPVGAIDLDPAALAGEKKPDLIGRVAGAFSDGSATLLMLNVPGPDGAEATVQLRPSTAVSWFGIEKPDQKPAAGMVALVWFQEKSKEVAEKVRFAREKGSK